MPVTASSFTSTVASACSAPDRSVPGARASTSAPSNAARSDAAAVRGEILSSHAVDVERGLPGRDPGPRHDQPPVVEGERALGRGRLHGQAAGGPAHPRVGDPEGDPSPAVVLRHLRVEAPQHQPGRALRVAQLEPAVLDLGPAQPLERAPRLCGEAGGRRPCRHRLAGVAHHDPRPQEADVRPRLRRPVDLDPLGVERDALEREARRRGRGPPLPEAELELAQAQRPADRARAPLLEEHPRRRASRRRVQERQAQGEQQQDEKAQPDDAAHEAPRPRPPPRARRRPTAGSGRPTAGSRRGPPPAGVSPSPFWPSASLTR